MSIAPGTPVVSVSLSGDLAAPYPKLPEGAAVAFSITRPGIEVLRVLLDTAEQSLDRSEATP